METPKISIYSSLSNCWICFFYDFQHFFFRLGYFRVQHLFYTVHASLDDKTSNRSEDCRPIRSLAVKRSMDRIKEMLDTEIAETEKEMLKVINGHDSIHHNYELVKSVDGVGLITAVELLVKTENFTKITTARQYSAYAGTAPYEKSSGKMDTVAKSLPHFYLIL